MKTPFIYKAIIALLFGMLIGSIYNQAQADESFDLNEVMWADFGLGSWHSNDGWWDSSKTYYFDPRATYWKWSDDGTERIGLIRNNHKWVEVNPSLGFRKGITDILEIGGGVVLQTSYGIPALYGGVELHTDRNKPVSVGLAAGLVHGYQDTLSAKHMPLDGYGYVAPTIQFTKKLKESAHSLRANVLGVGGDNYAVWFQYSYARK